MPQLKVKKELKVRKEYRWPDPFTIFSLAALDGCFTIVAFAMGKFTAGIGMAAITAVVALLGFAKRRWSGTEVEDYY
jgi:hypothetical protein